MKNEAELLVAIIDYDMNEMETKAYKMSLLYYNKIEQFFPKEIALHKAKTKKGDPRKSHLFRHCYKVLREHGDELKDNEINLYIHAQFDILRHITRDEEHPRISPEILSSPKAWIRWKLWKSKYDKAKKFVTTPLAEQVVDINKEREVIELLRKTKQYFGVLFDRYSAEDIRKALENDEFFLWVRWGKVCHYYLLLSPLVKEWLDKSKTNLIDKVVCDQSRYEPGITVNVQGYFKKEFSHEFM